MFMCLSQLGVERTTVTLIPMQIHGLVLAVFSSIVAPFGGFFASGFKRAFKVKVGAWMFVRAYVEVM